MNLKECINSEEVKKTSSRYSAKAATIIKSPAKGGRPSKAIKKVKVSVSLDPDMWEEFSRLCDASGESYSAAVNRVLKAYIKAI